MRLGLEAVHRSGLEKLGHRLVPRDGVVFALHRVRPASYKPFAPNRLLEVTPEFLEETIKTVRAKGFDIVSLDEALPRIGEGRQRPFACFTLDDAYRDNKVHALPVFARHGVPFTIYIPEHFADGTGQVWWVELELAIEASPVPIVVPELFGHEILAAATAPQKRAAFQQIYWRLRRMDEDEARRLVRQLCARRGADVSGLCRSLIMSWDDLRDLGQSPLASFGAHTIGHYALAKLHPAQALHEMTASKNRVEAELDLPCQHFCFPYGDAESAGVRDFSLARKAGFASAVTMQKGLIGARHKSHLMSLPRCSLNGEYQEQRYVSALLSGVPFAIWNSVFGSSARHQSDTDEPAVFAPSIANGERR